MARKKAPNAETEKQPGEQPALDESAATKPEDQAELAGTTPIKRPAEAGVRFSLAEATATLKALHVKAKLQDDEGDLLSVRAKFVIGLVASDIQFLPEVADAVSALLEHSQSLPRKTKNKFSLSVGRDFAGARYTIGGKRGSVVFNAQVDGVPSVQVVKGSASLALPLAFVLRDADFKTLTKYLSEKPKVTVEPPQQELDFPEAA